MIYAYRCEGCGEAFTVRATLTEKERGLQPGCPRCGSPKVVQDFSGVGVLRGGGAGAGAGLCGPAAGPGCC